MPLITTPAGASSNSYATLLEAEAYAETHLYASGWNAASDDAKEQALLMATRLLDGMQRAWTGTATTDTQALGWPRLGMLSRNGFAIASGEIPVALKNAQAEYARQLVGSDLTETSDVVAQGITSVKAGPVAVSFRGQEQEHGALARRWALEFQVPDAVIALLVPSWLFDPRDLDAPYEGIMIENV